VTKSFHAVQALKGVSFELREGEVHALLGENGAGKSTLIKVITGAHAPDSGTIEVGGCVVSSLTPVSAHAMGIACIYQQPALFPDLTVTENIGLRLDPPGGLLRVRWGDRRRRASELLQRVGAAISPDSEVRSLSMPEQQLVEIACALGAGARIVIMDEPTASLTLREQRLLFDVVRDLRSRGVGVIYISHRLEEIFALADRVTVLRDGQSVATHDLPKAGAENPSQAGLTEKELIRLMVGRDVQSAGATEPVPAGADRLSLRGIGCASSGVRDVSFSVRSGEVVGLAGLVGAGRTELARILFGITPASSGEILIDGQRVSIHSPLDAIALGIGYVPEDRRRHGLVLEMPVASNISMAVHSSFFRWGWVRRVAESKLADGFIDRLSIKCADSQAAGSSLSGGNQQKVALARWLATKPSVLVLDEPTQGVDVGAKSEIHRIIRDLAREGVAVLVISSDLPEVLQVSDRILVMRGGAVVSELPGGSAPDRVMAAALGKSEVAS